MRPRREVATVVVGVTRVVQQGAPVRPPIGCSDAAEVSAAVAVEIAFGAGCSLQRHSEDRARVILPRSLLSTTLAEGPISEI